MKKLLIAVLSVFIAQGIAYGQNPTKPARTGTNSDAGVTATATATELKVLQLNLWMSCRSLPSADKGAVDIIEQTDADIALLCEAGGAHGQQTLSQWLVSELAKRGKKYYADNQKAHVLILSKLPLENVALLSHTRNRPFVKSSVKVNGRTVTVYSAHLDAGYYAPYLPRGYSAKAWGRKIAPITDVPAILAENRKSTRDASIHGFIADAKQETKKGNLVILGGDLNEPSLLDWQANTKNIRDHRGVVINWGVSAQLLKAGYLDSFRERFPNALTHPGFTWPAGNTSATLKHLFFTPESDERERIDFTYYYPQGGVTLADIRIVGPSASVERGKITPNDGPDTFIEPKGVWPSDHKGTLTTFRIAPNPIANLPIAAGKFQATNESLQTYQYPQWFRDAKFGIWSVWGPMAVPRQGDWYSRNLYIQGSRQNRYHVAHYGHPSEFGFKDLIPLWKAEKWDPEAQMKFYKKVGAKYFCSIATHHDNFFLWKSKLNRWNAANMGPKKDVIGLWREAAKKEGLYFGVTEHLGASYTWFRFARGADKNGPKAGILYDGVKPEFADLYHPQAIPGDTAWLTRNPVWQREWYDRIKELVDNYHPDLLYSDSPLPFGDVGRTLLTHYYNQAETHNKDGVVYNCKEVSNGRWVQDYERGVAEGIKEHPWQIDTSIGDWIYNSNDRYKTGSEIIQMLVDVVSKNGNLLLCIPPTPEGELDKAQTNALAEIGGWMQINGEAIYSTRPWKVYGEGPSVEKKQPKGTFHGIRDFRKYAPGDLRFTVKGDTLYVFCMEPPAGTSIRIKSLGLENKIASKVLSVKLLGVGSNIKWKQTATELLIEKPDALPASFKTTVYAIQLDTTNKKN